MKLDKWLIGVYQEEQEKVASAQLDELMDQLPMEEVIKLAQISGPEKPEPAVDTSGKEKLASAKLAFMDKIARQLARTDSEVLKQASCKSKTSEYGMEKEDAFTSPEAQAKAKAMSGAMKASKGAPPKVRKAGIRMAGKEVSKVAGSLSASRRFRLEDKARRLVAAAGRPTRKSKRLVKKSRKSELKTNLQSGRRFREDSPYWDE